MPINSKKKHSIAASSVIITGTTSGFGLALLEKLYKNSIQIYCFNRRHDKILESRFPLAKFQVFDITESQQARVAINDIDIGPNFKHDVFERVVRTNIFNRFIKNAIC